MPTVTLDRNVFVRLVGKPLTTAQLHDRLAMLGTSPEEITKDTITVEVPPKRADLLSEQGLARALSSFVGVKTGLRSYKVHPSSDKVIIDSSVNAVRPFTACAVVKGLTFSDERIREIIQIQEKLHVTFGRNRKRCAIGVYPCEKIMFPIRYLAKAPKDISFWPLEAVREMTASEILSDHPTGRAYAHLLADCKKYPLFVDAKNQVLSMPPIINSHNVGKISSTTRDVFIECSGHQFHVVETCLHILVAALADMGGKVYSLTLQYPDGNKKTPHFNIRKVPVNSSYVLSCLGVSLSEKDIKMYLARMGIGYEKKQALVPAYRADIIHPIDVVEDIAIAYGYENFQPTIPHVATIASLQPMNQFQECVGDILSQLGLFEVMTYHITSLEQQTTCMQLKIPLVRLANALTNDYNALRAILIPSLLSVFVANRHRDYPQAIFGFGRVFSYAKTESCVAEDERLCIAVSATTANFTTIKSYLDALFLRLGISYSILPCEHPSFIAGRVGQIVVGDRKIGYVGEMHPQVLTSFGLTMPVASAEVDLELLLAHLSQ